MNSVRYNMMKSSLFRTYQRHEPRQLGLQGGQGHAFFFDNFLSICALRSEEHESKQFFLACDRRMIPMIGFYGGTVYFIRYHLFS